MQNFWLTVALLICTSCGPSLDARVEELVRAKNVWVTVAGERAYSYTLTVDERQPHTVSVSNPGMLRDDWLKRLECAGVFDCRGTASMRELFEFVLTLIDENLQSGGKLIVKYDDQMGYPKYIAFDDRQGLHSVSSVEVSNVKFVQE
jgi:hypothetical protein